MKKILLLNPPAFENKKFIRSGYCNSISKGGYYWQPIDLAAQSGILKNDFKLYVLDACAENMKEEYTLSFIKKNFSDIENIFFISSLASRDFDFKFIEKLKNFLNLKKILVSAGYLLFENYEVLKKNLVDGVLLDYTSPETIDFFNEKKDYFKTISTSQNIIDVKVLNAQLPKTFKYGIPEHLKFPIDKYYMPNCKKLPMVNIITNLGCPFKCDFCTWSNLKYRQREINDVINELKFLNKNQIKEVMFIDPTFGGNKNYTKKLLYKLIQENIKIGFSIECRVDLIDEEFVYLLSKAGCHSITFGLESGNDEILKNIRKGFTVSEIKTSFRLCHKYNIAPTGHFIIGLPGETKKTVYKTLNLACQIDCDFASFNIIMPLPGTKLFKEKVDDNRIRSCNDTEKPVLNLSVLTDEEVLYYSRMVFNKFYLRPKYILKTLKKFLNITQQLIIIKEFIYFFKKVWNQKR